MLGLLILLFIVVPFVELSILLSIAQQMGALPPLILVAATGVIGAALARRQGIRTLTKIQRQLGAGNLPTAELADAGMILVAGALLLTPGLLTDLFGFSLLVPPCRSLYRRLLVKYFRSRVKVIHGGSPNANPYQQEGDQTIDCEVITRREEPIDQ